MWINVSVYKNPDVDLDVDVDVDVDGGGGPIRTSFTLNTSPLTAP